jgi:hypothetical protein
MMLQSKISKMKKRLSSTRWHYAIGVLGFLCLLSILTSGLRLTTLPFSYGMVDVEIPVMSLPIDDPGYHSFVEAPTNTLGPKSTMIVLNASGDFYFGDLEAFSSKFNEIRNKFVIKQKDGEPKTVDLLQALRKWQYLRKTVEGVKDDRLAVFLPSSTVPVNLVIQVLADLRGSKAFDHVVLSNGLL